MKAHPAAERYPMLPRDRYESLRASIQANGQRNPVVVYEGQILDGRNRWKACEELGVECRTVEHDGSDPFLFAWDQNGERRDLVADQRYLLWKYAQEDSAGWQKQQRKRQAEANRARSEAAKARPRNDDGTLTSRPTSCGPTGPAVKQPNREAAEKKAEASKTNRGAVERMDRLHRERPDLAAKVAEGEVKPTQAIREMKRETVRQKLEEIAAVEVETPTGEFDVIVIDPPWQMQKIDRDERPNQTDFDYPTMSEAELAELVLPYADDCHVWCWATQKHLPMALRLLKAWNLKYVCTFVWHKPGGFQPVGLPQFNCEFALYARKGTPEFLDTKALPLCFNAPRGGHSEKPEEFYDVVRRITAGRRLDMFNRRAIDGFKGWGNESN